jgi:hypothetical protein
MEVFYLSAAAFAGEILLIVAMEQVYPVRERGAIMITRSAVQPTEAEEPEGLFHTPSLPKLGNTLSVIL